LVERRERDQELGCGEISTANCSELANAQGGREALVVLPSPFSARQKEQIADLLPGGRDNPIDLSYST